MGSGTSHNRNATPGSRLVQTKSNAWGSNNPSTSQSIAEPGNSWAQAMNSRSNNQLDLSSSSFPSLAENSAQSQAAGISSSQWQAGPPAREQTQSQNTRILQHRQQPHNDFSSMDQPTNRFQSHASLPRGAPPGLSQPVDGMSPDGTSQPRKTPVSQPVNGSIGQERVNGDANQSSRNPDRLKDTPLSDQQSPADHELSQESVYGKMSEKDKWGMAGWLALNETPLAQYRVMDRQQDVQAFENYSASESLLRSYPGAFAQANAYPPKPLDTDYTIPDCYIVSNVAPIQSRISGFTEDTLFYIFYTSPRDIIQEEVATELMSRKWRFHVKEKMWLTRDDTTSNPVILEKDVAEQGYYIWWDYRNWKRVRKMYILRYEDLDDHLSGGRSLAMPGLFQGGLGMMGGVNGGGSNTQSQFNAVPGLERMAAMGVAGRF